MRRSALSPQLVGILAMSAAGAVFSAHDALTKYLSATYPIGEIVFFRQLVSIALLTTYVYFTTGLHTLKTNSFKGQTTRSLLFVASTILIGTSVSVLPLATALAPPTAAAIRNALIMRISGLWFGRARVIKKPPGGGFFITRTSYAVIARLILCMAFFSS